jgi:hypothetical protein
MLQIERRKLLGMPRIDVLDEAVIRSPPMVVYNAVQNEAAGGHTLWMLYLESRPRGNMPMDREGAIFDITVRNKG